MSAPRVPVVAIIAATIAMVTAVATGVWAARNHAESQIQDLRDFVTSRHDKDLDRMMDRLGRIENKLDSLREKCDCFR